MSGQQYLNLVGEWFGVSFIAEWCVGLVSGPHSLWVGRYGFGFRAPTQRLSFFMHHTRRWLASLQLGITVRFISP